MRTLLLLVVWFVVLAFASRASADAPAADQQPDDGILGTVVADG